MLERLWREGTRALARCVRYTGPVVALGAAFCTSACCGPKSPESVDQAGTVRVSVTSVGTWPDYRDALQPKFSLTEDKALEEVVPTTKLEEQKHLSATSGSASVAFPTTSTTSTVNTLPNGKPAEDPGMTTVTKASGDASALSQPAPPQGDRTAADIPGFDAISNTALGQDPMLRYWAATALFQEVKLLNRYVRDAAVNGDYVPYVVRFNVALMPLRRHLPLDTYVNLSVFLGDHELAAADCPGKRTCSLATCKLPLVLPLLVTDDMEASLHARSKEQLHTLAVALSGMLQGIGFEGDLSHFDDALQRVLGRDLNSLMLVSRLTSNTLRVRFGAMQETQSDYAMVPRSEFVTAVVLVPRHYLHRQTQGKLSVWTSTQFVRVEDGSLLREKSASKDNSDVRRIAREYKVGAEQVADSWNNVVDGDWKGFAGHFSANPKVMLRELWLDVAQLQAGYSFDNFTVSLPPYAAPALVAKQVAFLHDDGKATTSVQLTGGADLDARMLCAKLVFNDGARTTNVLPSKLSVTGGGTEVDLAFPSLKAWGLNNIEAGKRHLLVNRAADPKTCWNTADKAWQRNLDTRYRLVKPAPPDVGFKVSILSGVVVEKDGKGTFRFELTQAKQNPVDVAVVNVTGGDVSSISVATRDLKGTNGTPSGPTPQPATGADFAVHLEKGKVTIVTLGLENLKAGAKVQTSFKNAHGAKTAGKDVPIQKDGK